MAAPLSRLFLLSPASTGGRRAKLLFSSRARFELAQRVRAPDGEALGAVFSFLSALYFRGKLTYAKHFAEAGAEIRVITTDRGLLAPDTRVTLTDLRAMSRGSIDLEHRPYRRPLERDAGELAEQLAPGAQVILLGSIATGKYTELLHDAFGERLRFPEAFVGRGDMSRGGLLLRAVRQNQELLYCTWAGAVVHGKRPAKLERLRPQLSEK